MLSGHFPAVAGTFALPSPPSLTALGHGCGLRYVESGLNGNSRIVANPSSRGTFRVSRCRLLPTILAIIAGMLLLGVAAMARMDANSAERTVLILVPGPNLVGWLEANTQVARVFDRIPELRAITDGSGAGARRRDSPSGPIGALRVLETGRGYWFEIAASGPIVWQQRPAAGSSRISLQPGRHLVAWGGLDGMPFASAIRGVSDGLTLAYNWDPIGQRFRVWTPAAPNGFDLYPPNPLTRRPPLESSLLDLHRGQAIGVIVRHPLNWRQPTGASPRLTFLGELPDQVRAQVTADTRWVVSQFRERFGVEAIPELLEIIVAAEPQDVFGPDTREWPRNATHASVPTDPFTQRTTILMPVQEWGPSIVDPVTGRAVSGRLVLLHEYYHAVQGHLAGRRLHQMPNWLIEAGPTWLQSRMRPQVGHHLADLEIAARYQLGRDPIPSLDKPSTHDQALGISPNHAVGHAVTLWLQERFGENAHIRLWRTFMRTDLQAADWQTVFAAAFPISVDDLYREYESWIRARYPFIQGRIVTSPLQRPHDLYVSLLGPNALPGARIEVSADGSFRTAAPVHGRYRFAVASPDGRCTAYLSMVDGAGRNLADRWFELDDDGIREATLRLPADFCATSVSGSVVDSEGAAYAGLQLTLCDRDTRCTEAETDESGMFRLAVPAPGEYVLQIAEAEGSCSVHYRQGSTVAGPDSAERLAIDDASVTVLEVQVSRPICGYQIRGRLLGLPPSAPRMLMMGLPDNPVRLQVIPDRGGKSIDAVIESDGRFVADVAGPGSYRLQLGAQSWITGQPQMLCQIEYRYGTAFLFSEVVLTEQGHAPIAWQVPAHLCRFTVSGLLTDLQGTPLAGFYVQACQTSAPHIGSQCGAFVKTGAAGEFSLFVPYQGEISIALGTAVWDGSELDRCGYSHQLTRYATQVEMARADVVGVILRVPREVVCLDN